MAIGQRKDEMTGAGGHIRAMPLDLNDNETARWYGYSARRLTVIATSSVPASWC